MSSSTAAPLVLRTSLPLALSSKVLYIASVRYRLKEGSTLCILCIQLSLSLPFLSLLHQPPSLFLVLTFKEKTTPSNSSYKHPFTSLCWLDPLVTEYWKLIRKLNIKHKSLYLSKTLYSIKVLSCHTQKMQIHWLLKLLLNSKPEKNKI